MHVGARSNWITKMSSRFPKLDTAQAEFDNKLVSLAPYLNSVLLAQIKDLNKKCLDAALDEVTSLLDRAEKRRKDENSIL